MTRHLHLMVVWQRCLPPALALLAAAAVSCSGSSDLHQRGIGSNSSFVTPGRPTTAELEQLFHMELERLGIDPARVVSAPPGPDNPVFDLRAQQSAGIELSWTEALRGDYDGNGEVNVADISPLGANILATVLYDDPTLRNGFAHWPSGNPDDEGGALPGQRPATGSGAENWRLARVDGDRNGELNAADISPLASRLGQAITGYRIYSRGSETDNWTLLPHPTDSASPVSVERPPHDVTRPVRYSFSDPAGTFATQYRVAPYDAASAGEGSPSLIVSAQDGVISTPPTAVLSVNVTAGAAPLAVTFDASGSIDTDGSIVRYELDFEGDGIFDLVDTEPIHRLHVYETDGQFSPRLRVTDDSGLTGIVSVVIRVGDAPSVHVTAVPDSGEAPLPVVLDASGSSDPSGEPVVFDWDLDGDGSFETSTGLDGVLKHTFTAAGQLEVGVRVTSFTGVQSVSSVQLNLTDDFDEVEPNDSIETASAMGAVALGEGITAFRGNVGFPGYDGFIEDYLSFDAAAGLELAVAVNYDDTAGDVSVRLLGPDGAFIATAAGSDGLRTLTHRVVIPGRLYLRIRLADAASAVGSVDYAVTVVPAPLPYDDVEPNDTLAAPQTITLPGLPAGELAVGVYDLYGRLGPGDLEDWWHWNAPRSPDNNYSLVAELHFAHRSSDLDLEWWYHHTDLVPDDFVVLQRSLGNTDHEMVEDDFPLLGVGLSDEVNQYLRVHNYGGAETIYRLRLTVTQ